MAELRHRKYHRDQRRWNTQGPRTGAPGDKKVQIQDKRGQKSPRPVRKRSAHGRPKTQKIQWRHRRHKMMEYTGFQEYRAIKVERHHKLIQGTMK